MKLRNVFALVLALAMALGLCACGSDVTPTTQPTTEATTQPTTEPTEPPMTAEKLWGLMEEASKDSPITKMQMVFGFEITVDMSAEDMEMKMTMSMDVDTSTISGAEGLPSYNYTSTSMSMMGMEFSESAEVYALEEDGTVTLYTYVVGEDVWSCSDTGMTVEEYTAQENDGTIGLDFSKTEGLSLDAMTTTVEGQPVYVLHFPAPESFTASFSESLGELSPEELDTLEVPCIAYVDMQTYLPLRMVIDLKPMMDLLSDQLASSMVGEVTADMEVDITTTDLDMLLGYGQQDVPELDEATKALARGETADTTDPTDAPTEVSSEGSLDLGDGKFLLDCGDEDMIITLPEGWYGQVYDVNNIYLYNDPSEEDALLYGDYYYLEGWTEEDLQTYLIDYDVEFLEGYNALVSQEEGPSIEGYTTYIIMGDGVNYYYAWADMGEGMLLAYVYDYTEPEDAAAVLVDMVAMLSPAAE